MSPTSDSQIPSSFSLSPFLYFCSFFFTHVHLCICVCVQSHFSSVQLCDPMDRSLPSSSAHGILQGKTTGVGCHDILQGIFPTKGLNLNIICRLHWQEGSLPLAPSRKPTLICIVAIKHCNSSIQYLRS